MKDVESEKIVTRFFQTIDEMKKRKLIRGRQTFCTRYGINKRNFYFVMENPGSGMFEPAWMMYLVRDYNISPEYLLTGVGEMVKKPEIMQILAKSLQKDLLPIIEH